MPSPNEADILPALSSRQLGVTSYTPTKVESAGNGSDLIEEIHPNSFQDKSCAERSSRVSQSSSATSSIYSAPFASLAIAHTSLAIPSSSACSFASASSPALHTHTKGTVPMMLTHSNLAEHHVCSAHLWNDPAASLQIRQDLSKQLKAAIRDLGIELPEQVVNDMIASFDGMAPMERYLVEMGKPLGRQENTEGRVHASKPTVAVPWEADMVSSGNGKADRHPMCEE